MRSIACAACGTVRWDSSLRCPACGSATALPEPPTSVVAAPPVGRRRPVFDVRWRLVSETVSPSAKQRRERLEIAIALVIVALLAAALFVYDAPYFGALGASPQVLLSEGTVWPNYGVSGVGGEFTADRAGTLVGGWQVSNPP